MLALTPVPLQTAGERSLFAELVRWDTGGAVRAAVVAAIPFTDGQLNRRISDAILFVPEGVAVVRVAEVPRQSGVVTATPEGAWSIAPQAGPGDVLQIGGGGSTPLDGLMRAGMETALRLRRAGLEPGRIARLTVLVGEVSGLVPADGDLGEGDQVALLDTRSLLLGIARCSRYSQVDNPRLWTTADVRAALEALGLGGRAPTVEELNGEGFPYSPYVLRRPELLAPAAMATLSPERSASPVAAFSPGAAASPLAVDSSFPVHGSAADAAAFRDQPSPAAIAHAVAVSAAAATAAAAPASAPSSALRRDTVAIDPPAPAAAPTPMPVGQQLAAPPVALPPQQPVAPPQSSAPAVWPAASSPVETGGIGGLFRSAEPGAAPSPADTGGIGGLFRSPEPEPEPSAAPALPRTAVFAQPPAPTAPPEPPAEGDEDKGHGRRTGLLAVLALCLVALLAVAGWLVLRDPDEGGAATAAPPSDAAAQTADPGPPPGTVQDVDGARFTLQAVQVDDTCVGHAYGDTATFFEAADCTGLSRALYSTQVDGGAVVVSVARVRMPDTATARDLRALTDRNGSGNVSDLLREGVTYPGAPAELSSAEYASAVSGPTVTIVESSWVDPAAGSAADVDRLAGSGLALQVPPFPGE